MSDAERLRQLPLEKAPLNLRLGMEMAVRFALEQEWFDFAEVEGDIFEGIEYWKSEGLEECKLEAGGLLIRETHDLVLDEKATQITFCFPLTGSIAGMFLAGNVSLTPRWNGPRGKNQFGLEVDHARLCFFLEENRSLDFIVGRHSVIVTETKGKKEPAVVEMLFDGRQWESRRSENIFSYVFDPKIVEAARPVWLSLVRKAAKGELLALTTTGARKKVEAALLVQGAMVKELLRVKKK